MRYIVLLVVLFVTSAVSAQTELCKERLIKSFAYMQTIYSDSSNLYMHYRVKTMQASNQSIQTDEVKAYMSDSAYVVVSSMASYYSDKKDAFMIVPLQQKIYRLDLQPVQNKSFDQSSLYRKSLLDSSTILSCAKLENQSEKISMKPPTAFTQYTNISKVDYVIDAANGFIKECIIYYTDGNALVYTQYFFLEIKNNAVLPFPRGVKELILNKNNVPVSMYRGYTYTDLRQIK